MTFSDEQVKMLSADLDAARVKTRRGGGGMSLSYLEGYDVIAAANDIFGFDGWNVEVDDVRDVGGAFMAIVTVSVDPGGVFVSRQDVGVGLVNGNGADAKEVAVKGAVTDAMKRAFRTFGNQFGNSLYDKDSPLHQGNGGARPTANRTPAGTTTPGGSPSRTGGAGRITDRQASFAQRLARENGHGDADTVAQAMFGTPLAQLGSRDASKLIDALKEPAAGDAYTGDGAADYDNDVPF